ncbi:M protein [Punta Toro virus]|uniref:Envelopment polyprotein n=1 Tax=Punta toro phlebovirus TaxID=11587 RepID=A0A0F6ZQV4_PTPV|nr:M protein [Punta Toro virus]AKF42403.1 M protein [Punta Toro virus]
MIFTILNVLTRAMLVMSMYSLTTWDSSSRNDICFSNDSPLEGLVYYWETHSKKHDYKKQGSQKCRVGDSDKKMISNVTIISLISEIQKSISELSLSCGNNDNSTGQVLTFNGLEDTIRGDYIVDCVTGLYQSDIGVGVGLGRINHDHQQVKNKAVVIDEKEKMISLLETQQSENDIKTQVLMSEIEQLKNQLSKRRNERGQEKRDAEKLMSDLMARNSDLRNHNVILTDEISQIKNNITIHRNRNMMSTTVVPAILSVALLSSSVGPITAAPPDSTMINPWPHAKNRVGTGMYKYDENDESGCRPIRYGVSCIGFDFMLKMDKYPFFNAFIGHKTPLESFADKIIEKEEETCEIGTNKEFKCFEERAYIKGTCPTNINAVHYIDNKGKLRYVKCKENLEMTEDCAFCRKIKKKAGQSVQVQKTSVPLQDAICQENSDIYSGPKIPFKGVCKIGLIKYKECKFKTSSYETISFITLKGKGKIYIEHLMLKNIEVVTNVSFVCYEHAGQDEQEVEHRALKRVSVNDCKIVDNSKQKICTGDHIFCEKYDCSTSYPDVTCIHTPGSGPLYINLMGSWIKPQCVGYERVLVDREVKQPLLVPEQNCDTCVSECLDEGVHIKSTGFEITSAVACSHGSCISAHQEASTSVIIPYPGLLASVGGRIGIHLSHTSDSASVHMVVVCPPRDSCAAHNCLLCYHGILNYQCHSTLSAILTSFLLILFIYTAFSVTTNVLYVLRLIPKQLKSPVGWLKLFVNWLLTALRIKTRRVMGRINQRIGWVDHHDVERPRHREPMRRFKTTLLLTLIMVTGGNACSNTVVANSKQTRCVQEGSNTKCSITATITLRAGVIGAESCFIIKGPMENQQKTISIKTISSETVCREGSSFWTSLYIPSCLSSRRCHLVGDCVGNKCQSWRDDQLSREFSGVKDNHIMNENKCFEQCGAIGCGCFNINPSCLYVHAYLKSARNEAVRVFSCSDWVHRVSFEVKGPDGEMELVTLGSLGTKFLNWGTLSLSLDAEGISGTNSISFLESSKGGFALYDEGYSEIPREGFLGEIRCSSESAAISAHKSCIRAPGLIKYKPMTDQIECTASLVDPFAIFLKGSLPQTRNGQTFTSTKDKKTVQAFTNGAIKALLSINLDDHEIIFINKVKSCDATFLNVSGCYSCDYGAHVCVKVKSSESADFFAESEDKTTVLSFPIQSGTRDYCQVLHFQKPLVDERLSYSCGSEPKLIVIKGTLVYMGVYDFRNKTGGSSTVINPSEGTWSISNWFSGLLDWLGGPMKAILKILGFIAIGIVCFILFMILIRIAVNSINIKKKN